MTLSAIPSGGNALAGTPLFSGKPILSKSTGPSFGTIVRKKVADAASIAMDPLAQLTLLLQNGTPINTIVDTIVKAVTDRVKSATPQTARLRTALAPPGTAPPDQTAAEQVAALVRKLQTVLKNVTGGTETVPAGQQNDISGSILDAASTAKEIPAQAQTAPTPTPVDLGSLVQSILEGAVAQLQAAPVVAASVPAPQTPAAQPHVAAPEAQPPDLLSRIILRATNGSVRSDAAPAARSTSSPSTGGASATFARLMATAERATQNGGGSSRDAFGSNLSRDPGKAAVAGGKSDVSNLAAFAVPGSADISADPAKATNAGLTPYTTVDPEAILSQIVKGISIKPDADGVHQMQLHLQPAHLGDVTLDLRVDGSSVTANVVAQSADVRDALVNNQHHLARAFAESGLKLTGFSVNLSGGDARGFQQGQHNSQGFGRRYVVHETAGSDDVDAGASNSASPNPANGSLDLLDHLA